MINITDYIPVGKENAVTRSELCSLTGMSDSANRDLISDARERGVPIIASHLAKGYYIADSEDDKDVLLKELWSKALKLLRCFYAVKKGRVPTGQLRLEIVEVDADAVAE